MQVPKSNYKYGFLRVAAVVPSLKVGNIAYNTEEITKAAAKADSEGASFIVFPELALTGYTVADLFHQELVWESVPEALNALAKKLRNNSALIFVGSPLLMEGKHINAAVAIYRGKILGIVPKTYLPGYKEFYEKRWFSSAKDLTSHSFFINGEEIPVGTNLLFKADKGKAVFAAEICEDLWGPLPPSSFHAVAGANVIANLSSSNELVGKADYRRELVKNQSARTISGYVYASSGMLESTTDLVFSGHSIIADNGNIISETKMFERETQIALADLDIHHSEIDRIRTTSFTDSAKELKSHEYRTIFLEGFAPKTKSGLLRPLPPNPFLPNDIAQRHRVSEQVFNIQVAGLSTRLLHTGIRHAVIGLSGGLDSTLALLVVVKAFEKLGISFKNIHAFTMPGFGTTHKTKSNAYTLAEAAGITLEEIDITKGSSAHFKDIKHDGKTEDTTFENVQARYRTMILMNKANQVGGLVIGTGDLSEIALGWATFNGDHISHYNVNASVPKTLVRHVVASVSETTEKLELRKTLEDILNTPVSPELKRPEKGRITQKTEEIIGPYELHDFFLYHFIRWGSAPEKILFLAEIAHGNSYSKREIKKWLTVFIKRFFGNQWKRSVASDGPKVGSVSLSPRGDWRMASDADLTLWLNELN